MKQPSVPRSGIVPFLFWSPRVIAMTEDNDALGSIEYADGYYVARLERMLEHEQKARGQV